MLSTLTSGRGRSLFPLTLQPLAWFYAHPSYLVFDDAQPDRVGSWKDRTGNAANTINRSGASWPLWSPNGWRSGVGAVGFDGAAAFLNATSGPLATFQTGADVPFSCLLTARIDASTDHGILYWLDGGTARSHWRTNNTPPEVNRYVRTDDAASSVTVTGALDMGTTNNRFGLVFPGTTVTTYRGRDIDNNASACNVGTCTFSQFELGRTSVGQLDGPVVDLVIVPRAITAAEWQAYVYYSIGEFG